jgi:hypothetical protein
MRFACVVTHNDGDFVDALLLYCETVRYSASKERLGEACAQRHGVSNLHSCFYMITNHNDVTRWKYALVFIVTYKGRKFLALFCFWKQRKINSYLITIIQTETSIQCCISNKEQFLILYHHWHEIFNSAANGQAHCIRNISICVTAVCACVNT